MGTTQRKEQRKMKLEKEIIRLTKLHQNKDKRELIQNINHVLRAQGIHLNRKVKWICKVTGSPEGTVYTWFTNARCRRENKIPLYALCQMALALRISVYEFFSADHFMEIAEKHIKEIEELICDGKTNVIQGWLQNYIEENNDQENILRAEQLLRKIQQMPAGIEDVPPIEKAKIT